MDPHHNFHQTSSAHQYTPQVSSPGLFPSVHDGSEEDELSHFHAVPPAILPDLHLVREVTMHNMALAADQHQQSRDNGPCGQPWPRPAGPSVSLSPYGHSAASSSFSTPSQQQQQQQQLQEQVPYETGNDPGFSYQAVPVVQGGVLHQPHHYPQAVSSEQCYSRSAPGLQCGYDQGQMTHPQFQPASHEMLEVDPSEYPDQRAILGAPCDARALAGLGGTPVPDSLPFPQSSEDQHYYLLQQQYHLQQQQLQQQQLAVEAEQQQQHHQQQQHRAENLGNFLPPYDWRYVEYCGKIFPGQRRSPASGVYPCYDPRGDLYSPSLLAPRPGPSIELANFDLWRRFHYCTSEMIITKTGR